MAEGNAVRNRIRAARLPLFGLLAVLLFTAVLMGYAKSGQSRVQQLTPQVSDGVNVAVDLVSIDPVARQATLRTTLFPAGRFLDSQKDTFAIPLRVISRSVKESTVYEIDAGQPVGGSYEFVLPVEGNASIYPFDRYRYAYDDPQNPAPAMPAPMIRIEAVPYDDAPAPAVNVSSSRIAPAGLVGWTESWRLAGDGSTLSVELVISRSGAVLGAVGVIVLLTVAMACLAATVAWTVATGRRPVEPTFASWFGAMLFSLIPLQNFMPDSPPVGAWIDVCVFLWAAAVLLISMGVFVISWIRFRERPDYSELRRRKQHAPEPTRDDSYGVQ